MDFHVYLIMILLLMLFFSWGTAHEIGRLEKRIEKLESRVRLAEEG